MASHEENTCISKFNIECKTLINYTMKIIKANADKIKQADINNLEKYSRIVMSVISNVPDEPIKQIGPHMFAMRDTINNSHLFDIFTKTNGIKIQSAVDGSNKNSNVVDRIMEYSELWKASLHNDQIEIIHNSIKLMMSIYIDYLIALKNVR